jgi:hypothetical protein
MIVAIRRPGRYLLGLSAIAAGVTSSLKVFEPARDAVDKIPYVVASDWLFYAVLTAIFGVALHLTSRLIGSVWGAQPFDWIACRAEQFHLAPSLDGYMGKRLSENGNRPNASLGCRVRPAESSELPLVNQLNREVFMHSAFALPLYTITRRNDALFQENQSMFAIVEALHEGAYVPVGMSHIVPLNDIGTSLYVRTGGLKDAEIQPVHIAGPDEWPSAIVLFSMGVLRSSRALLKDRSLLLPIVFADHLLNMVSELRTKHPEKRTISIYAQTERPRAGIGRMLQRLGFEDTEIVTGDGYNLWELTLNLPVLSAGEEPRPALSQMLGRNAWQQRLPGHSTGKPSATA